MKRSIEFFSKLEIAHRPNVCYGAARAEGLPRVLSAHSNTVLAYDELQSLIDKCQIQGSALLPLITTLFESDSWDNATKASRNAVRVRNARLSLIGCCTTETYANMWNA